MIIKKHLFLFLLLFASLASRIIVKVYFADVELDYEWGVIVSNLYNSGVFGFRTIEGTIVPNIFMPPFYPIFIYLIKIIANGNSYYLEIIIYLQVLLSVYAVYIFYKTLLHFFSEKLAYFSSFIFSLFPINVYSCSQISSASIILSFLVIYFYSFLCFIEKNSNKNLIIFSIMSAALILLRGEFIAFYVITLLYYFYDQKDLKFIIGSFLITLILVSPYLIRNYKTFGVVTIAKAEGYDLWKGNNPRAKAEGYYGEIIPEKLKIDIGNLKPTKDYDVKIDELFKNQAISYIAENPLNYIKLYFSKFFAFLFFDLNSSYPQYYNPLHLVPKIILSISTIIGIFLSFRKENFLSYLSIYYFFSISLFSIFFILPRYSLFLLPVQIILSTYALKKIKK